MVEFNTIHTSKSIIELHKNFKHNFVKKKGTSTYKLNYWNGLKKTCILEK